MPRKTAKSASKESGLSDPKPVRLTPEIEAGIARVQKKTKRSDQEIIRLAAEVGLAALAMLDDDIPGILAKFAIEKANESAIGGRLPKIPATGHHPERESKSKTGAA